MSDEKPASKMTLSALLKRVEAIASGADRAGIPPGAEGHDESTAPDGTARWCASVLRILLLRVIEHVVQFRKDVADLRAATKDLPALREQVDEASKLVTEIVQAIRRAEAEERSATKRQAPATAPAEEIPDAPRERTEEEVAAAAHQAKVDEMAAAAARATTGPDSFPAPPIPLKRDRNPANEKV